MKAIDWLAKAQGEMNGNCFVLDSKNTNQDYILRIADYSIAFDNKNKGFYNNESQKCERIFSHCVSFNNIIIYQLPYLFSNGIQKKMIHFLQNQSLKTLKDKTAAIKKFYAVRNAILLNYIRNTFNDDVNFDDAIKSLT